MFIELIDLLRCTRPHDDSWLVAALHEMRGRNVMEGLLSCPVCAARYPITNGVAWFDAEPDTTPSTARAPSEDGLRVAAYLNLIEPGIVVLGGAWAASAEAIAQLGSRVIALNSPELRASPRVSVVGSEGTVPLARECLDGVALDSSEPRLVESAARALKNGARLLAPLGAAVPAGLVELARDEKWWVAVREWESASAPVQIARR